MRARSQARRGVTLIELIITLVLVAIIGAAAGRLLISQTRYYARMTAQKEARSVTRNARNIMQTELSMIEAVGGVAGATNDTIAVRMPYAWGVYCSSNTMMLLPTDSAMYAMATYAGFAIKDTTQTGAYSYSTSGTVSSGGTAANCTGLTYPITAPTNGSYVTVSSSSSGSPTAGSPMFLWQTITYKFANSGLFPGTRGLYRRVGTGTAEEILAPFESTAQFKFYNLYADTAQTAVPTLADIRGIEIQFDAQSPTRASNRASGETARIKTAIFFRNRVD
jgi:prepilin-type N-terminal cleavage/methylation domain-containing protein